MAIVAARAGHDVLLWAHDPSVADGIRAARRNPIYMPSIELDARIAATHSLAEAAEFSDSFFMVVPSHHYRRVLAELGSSVKRVDVISGTKGIENETLETMSQVTSQVLGEKLRGFAVLSGPTFALEAAPILRTKIRPFVREARPLVRSLVPVGKDLVASDQPLTQSSTVVNTLFNLLAYNPSGREGPAVAGRDEGFMFFLAWVAHQSASLWSNADAHGPLRSLTLGGTCQSLREMTSAAPVLVVTAARWISPRSTVARLMPGACSACGTSTQTCSSKPRFQTRVQAPLFSGRLRWKTSEARPRPIGSTTRPCSTLTACVGHITG